MKEGIDEIQTKLDNYKQMRRLQDLKELQNDKMLKVQNAYKVDFNPILTVQIACSLIRNKPFDEDKTSISTSVNLSGEFF